MKILLFIYVLITIGIASAALENITQKERINETYEYEEAGAIEAYKDFSYLLETNFSVEIDQNVQGNGFYSSYKYTSVPDPYGNIYGVVGYGLSGMVAQDHSHGSGTMDKQYKLSGYTFYTEAGVVRGEGKEPVIDDDEEYSLSQFTDASGQPAVATMKTRTEQFNGVPVLFVEAGGTYQAGSMMGASQIVAKADWALLGAVAEGADANWFIKFTAPKATIEAQRAAFDAMLRSVQRGG